MIPIELRYRDRASVIAMAEVRDGFARLGDPVGGIWLPLHPAIFGGYPWVLVPSFVADAITVHRIHHDSCATRRGYTDCDCGADDPG